MLQNLTGWHALIVLAIVLLVFGASKLPALAKSVGQSMRILKDEVKDGAEASVPDHPATQVHETIAREPEKELRTP
jgi:sec-independent protein translocase protein TatA